MKERYFYYRDDKNRPIITECSILDSTIGWAIGYAICSKNDIPCKKQGRAISKSRAMAALSRKNSFLPIERKEIRNVVSKLSPPLRGLNYKAVYLGEV